MGDRLAAALAHRHAVAGVDVAVDRRVDGAAGAAGRAPDETPDSRAASARCGRGRRTGPTAIDGRGRSWPRPSARWCPCPAGARCRDGLTPPMPDRLSPQWAISALTSVPLSCPAAGCTTSPRGLLSTTMSSSSNTISSAISSPLRLRRHCLRHVDCDRIAGRDMISGVADGGAPGGDGTGQKSAPSAASATVRGAAPRAHGRDGSSPRRRRR